MSLFEGIFYITVCGLLLCYIKDYLFELFCKYKDNKDKQAKQLADDISKHIIKHL